MPYDADHCRDALTLPDPVRLLDEAAALVVVFDGDGNVTYVNRAAERFLRSTQEDAQALARTLLDGDSDAPAPYDEICVDADGHEVVVAWQGRVVREDDGRVRAVIATGMDVTEQRRTEAQVAHLAYHDALTGLPNRALLTEHLQVALGRARRRGTAVAVLSLDLHDFKLVNDSLGHQAGDRLLQKVTARLSARRRGPDVLARQGGDELLLLIADLEPATAEQQARAAGEAVLAALQTPFVVSGAEFHVGGCVGISLHPHDAQDAETLLRHADAAMYQAKRIGPDEVQVFRGVRDEPLRRLSMTSRLRAAISEEELVLHWQPIVDPASGRLESLEALVRWQDPLRGLLGPAEFIPFAEETGLIRRVGLHVLELICRQRRAWAAQGLEPQVTMNVSPRQLEPGFGALLAERHAAHGLSPRGLTVEITESAAMQDAARVEPVLAEIADIGVRIAIDDFGAGYSSLSRLRRLPVDMLKIDRQFLEDEPTARKIVTAVVELSEALGMQAVAEGVEGEDQRVFLVGLNCPLAQGFLLGRPLAADAATALLREQRPRVRA